MLAEAFRRRPNKPWIAKPVGKAQGKGIFLVTKLSQLRAWNTRALRVPGLSAGAPSNRNGPAGATSGLSAEAYILSRYIDRPLLIGGRKFDLRLYGAYWSSIR